MHTTRDRSARQPDALDLEERVRVIAREEAQCIVARMMGAAHAGTYDSRTAVPPGCTTRKGAIRAIKRTPGAWCEDDGTARTRIWYVTAADYHRSRRRTSPKPGPTLRAVPPVAASDDDLADAALAAAGLRRTGSR